MTCGAQFMGGPADGRLFSFPGDEPSLRVVFSTWTRTGPREFDLGEFVYVRQVSQMDDGPLWVFVPENPESAP